MSINYQEFLDWLDDNMYDSDERASWCAFTIIKEELIRNHEAWNEAQKLKRKRPCKHCGKLLSTPYGTSSSQGGSKCEWICKECF